MAVPAGLLKLEETGATPLASEFVYGLRYLNRANAVEIDPVSLSLKHRESVRGVALHPVHGLALFGAIRDAAPDAWGRRVIEARLKAPANSLPESTYLLAAGGNRVGALDVREGIDSAESAGELSEVRHLDYLLEAAERIEAGLPVPARLAAFFDAGSSLGGARPKVTVKDGEGRLWLAKLPSHSDQYDQPLVEAATLKLASLAGLTVPRMEVAQLGACRTLDAGCVGRLGGWMQGASRRLWLFHGQATQRSRRRPNTQPEGPGPIFAHGGVTACLFGMTKRRFAAPCPGQKSAPAHPRPKSDRLLGANRHALLIERFDRVGRGGGISRRHFVSALTMVGCAEQESPRKNYVDIADALRRYGAATRIGTDLQELFARMLFNIFVTNDDDHLRNHGFLWQPEEAGWALSPLYDVVPRPTLATERYLHLGIGPHGRFASLTNAMGWAARFGLTHANALAAVDQVWRVVREWKTHFEAFGVPPKLLDEVTPAFRHARDIGGADLGL